ncbi:MAG TPA: hypothetical protein DD405_02430 [Desulfobacteraceae bacterium]|nr:hypothetical protein [Desulfobacteraceae bacterium]
MTTFQPLRFGKYLLLDRIAMGGMAELYRAKITGEKGFEKLIAIKKILPHLIAEEDLINSFIDEAKLAAFLQHQNIAQIYDFGKIENSYFIAMEFLAGKDLRFVIKKTLEQKRHLGLPNILHIISQICAGIDYAHNLKDYHGKPLNIIHRDIGPHNVFITYSGQVKIIDFGIAKAAIHNTTTQIGSIKGKLAYMSPEQAKGEKINHRSDIFSVGILLYEMVTEKQMFAGDALQVFPKVKNADFEPAVNINAMLPEQLYRILDLALAKKPENRYQSADKMYGDITELIATFSLQPNDRVFAANMKNLFEKEAETEELLMREAALVDSMGINISDITKTEPVEETIAINTAKLGDKKRSWFRSMLFLLLFFSGALFFIAYYHPNVIKMEKIFPGIYEKYFQPGISGRDLADLNTCKKLILDGNFKKAENLLKSIMVRNPSINHATKPVYSKLLTSQAERIIQTDHNKAELLLLKAVNLDAENVKGHYLLGRLYGKNGDKANASYKKADAINNKMPEVFFNLGYIFMNDKKYDKAEEMYLHVVDLAPDFMDEVLVNLAYVQERTGRLEESIKNLEKACSINPENKTTKRLLKKFTTKHMAKKTP